MFDNNKTINQLFKRLKKNSKKHSVIYKLTRATKVVLSAKINRIYLIDTSGKQQESKLLHIKKLRHSKISHKRQ